jgi:hypothetical protein
LKENHRVYIAICGGAIDSPAKEAYLKRRRVANAKKKELYPEETQEQNMDNLQSQMTSNFIQNANKT